MIATGVLATDTGAIPDHAMLIAAVAVRQAGTRTAQIAGRLAVRATTLDPLSALVATFHHGDAAAAARALCGSFHPRIAETVAGHARRIW